MRRAAVPAFLLLLSGCSLAFGPDDDAETFGGADGGGSPGPLVPVADPAAATPPEEASDLQLESTCDGSSPTRVTLMPLAAGGLGSVQYSAAALAAKRWPDGSNLSVDDFRAFFSDKQPLTAAQVAARFTLSSPTDGVLSLRIRLPHPQAREPLHVVAVADVSLSASDLASYREAVLTDLAVAIDKASTDRLSLVSYGESPEVLFEAPLSEAESTLKSVASDAGLPEKDGNNLAAAIERAHALLADEPGHIVVLSDGGQAMNDHIASAVDSARAAGHLVSAIQFAAPMENDASPEASFFYNGALLAGIAARGGGSHLYADELADLDNGQSTLAARYEELFAVGASQVSVTVTLPSGVTSTLPVPEEGQGGGVSVSAIRGFGVELPVAGCEGAFTPSAAGNTEFLLTVKAGPDALIDEQRIAFATALANGAQVTLDNAIVAVVTALRQRDDKSAKLAFELVLAHRALACEGQGEVGPSACGVAQELETFLRGVCDLVSPEEVLACIVD